MRVVIDLQGAQSGSRFRGIGRYSLSVTEAIVRNRGDHEVIVALSNLFPETIEYVRYRFQNILPKSNIKVWQIQGPVHYYSRQNNWRRIAAQKIRYAFLKSIEPDIVLITSLFEGDVNDCVTTIEKKNDSYLTAVVLYDLIPLIYKDDYLADDLRKEWYHWKADFLKQADICLSISEASRQEGIQYLGIEDHKIVNISASIDHSLFNSNELPEKYTEELLKKFRITKPFIMYSGATDARKNLRRLIGAFSKLPSEVRKEHQLVLAGGMPRSHQLSLKKCVHTHNIEDQQVVFTEYIEDDEMVALYRLSKCYVFPSYHEGFGLPALEAMACGTAVIGSNISSIPEVIGRDDALFDPFSEDDIANRIKHVITDNTFREKLSAYGLERAKLFSWDKVAKKAIGTFENRVKERETQSSSKSEDKGSYRSRIVESLVGIDHPITDDRDLITAAFCLNKLIPRRDPRPRLYVDISELHDKDSKTGIQRVVKSVISHLLQNPPEGWEVKLVYATKSQGYRHAAAYTEKLFAFSETFEEDAIIDPREGDFFLGLDFQDVIVSTHYKYFNYLRNIGVQVKFIIYDMLPIKLPRYFSDGAKENYERWLRIIAESDGAICISQSVAKELAEWLKKNTTSRLRPFDISWFHLGADFEYSAPTQGLPDKWKETIRKIRSKPSFLMVGTLEPRKGHQQVLSAFKAIWRNDTDIQLVIVGKQGWKVDRLAKKIRSCAKLGKKLIWLEKISDEYLSKIYESSTCLIAASEGEGFGLPLIEAAKHNLPIIARDIPVFREVAAEHVTYFTGTDPGKLSTAIMDWMRKNNRKEIPEITKMQWVNWSESIEQLKRKLFSNNCLVYPQRR